METRKNLVAYWHVIPLGRWLYWGCWQSRRQWDTTITTRHGRLWFWAEFDLESLGPEQKKVHGEYPQSIDIHQRQQTHLQMKALQNSQYWHMYWSGHMLTMMRRPIQGSSEALRRWRLSTLHSYAAKSGCTIRPVVTLLLYIYAIIKPGTCVIWCAVAIHASSISTLGVPLSQNFRRYLQRWNLTASDKRQ